MLAGGGDGVIIEAEQVLRKQNAAEDKASFAALTFELTAGECELGCC